MSKEILQDIIENFEPDKFLNFFREKNRNFRPRREELKEYDDEFFISGEKIGDIEFDTANMLFACFKCKDDLTERSSKKLQYEKARKVLKGLSYDSGIFVFYDKSGNFRFSLIYTNYAGKRDWSNYKRFTYYVSKERTNKTFKSRIGESKFDNYEAIKEAFSVDKVTKEFYTDIANWYFWAVDNVEFPEQAEEITDGRKIAVLRLITRLIFIWFMRELKLIPKELFIQENIETDLKDTSEDESTYYKAILQNLFFATLSTPKEQRQFTDEIRGNKGHNKDFGNNSVFRYQELFKKPEELKSLFGDIPYLNGGLFECLDNKEERIYIDGFSRTKKNQPIVQNYLFFAKEHKEDLNNWYGTEGKNYNVRGLLDILSSYNFTTDENSSDDSDVALDPELLGKVFENLLASFNPETSTTARKATGSFYTPREIVDYMVTESLKEYFKTHLTQVEELNEKLESLFNKSITENPFSSKESRHVVQLIENVRIVDPAVGSGAFPMGILNKLVFILNKVDSGNKLWKEAQLKSVESMPDSTLREQTKKHIEKYFTEKNHDYGRKLYLIQKCIYGVDIQQIAVEIAKLRFFIALLVDERIDKDDGDNWGIEPLPNLDFKIMQGNSLLEEYEGIKLFDEKLFIEDNTSGKSHLDLLKESRLQIQKEVLELRRNKKLTKFKEIELVEKASNISKKIKFYADKDVTDDFENDIFDTRKESIEKREELKNLHQEFFETNNKEHKEIKRKQIEKVEWELIEETLISQGKKSELPKLQKIRKTNTKPFFLWKLHYADVFEKGGFDIVIGNPPYIRQELITDLKSALKKQYKVFNSIADLYTYFYECAFNLSRSNGITTFITNNGWIKARYGTTLRKFFLDNCSLLFLLNFEDKQKFESAIVETNVLFFKKEVASNNFTVKFSNEIPQNYSDYFVIKQHLLTDQGFALESHETLELKIEIEKIGIPLKDWDSTINRGVLTGFNEAFYITGAKRKELITLDKKNKNIIKPILRGRDIKRWIIEDGDMWLIFIPWHFPYNTDDNIKGASELAEIEFKKEYRTIYEHLLNFKSQLENRNKAETGIRYEWYALQRCAATYFQDFEKEKIVWITLSDKPKFAYEDKGFYSNDSTFIMTGKNLKYYLAILNSKVSQWYFELIAPTSGMGTTMWKKAYIERLPIPKPKDEVIYVLENISSVIIECVRDKNIFLTTLFEYLIDAMVYELYFPESVKDANAEVIELVKKQIPDISNIEDKDKKLEMIEKAYKKLSDPENEINKRIERQNTLVEEVKIINASLDKKQ